MDFQQSQKYSVNQQLIETLLAWIRSGEIAIPEIQRPFVWKASKVRDLLDSLYRGFPIGYLIIWKSQNVKLKDGSSSDGKKILIDGQQRIGALSASILGNSLVDVNYSRKTIRIAFNPIAERFEVAGQAETQRPEWIKDIHPLMTGQVRIREVASAYIQKNPAANRDHVEDSLENLKDILRKQVGMIELDSNLDLETVNTIFTRINSEGVRLSMADFVMSQIAANETYGGSDLRKTIDYFCHLSALPGDINRIKEADTEFCKSHYFRQIDWISSIHSDVYNPHYTDVLRVAYTSKLNRGRFADLVGLLKGRDFVEKDYKEEIAERTYAQLKNGIFNFTNKTNYQRFSMIIKSTGFIVPKMIRAKNPMNMAYVVYLMAREEGHDQETIERLVRKWFVMSTMTSRYSGSTESQIDTDIENFVSKGIEETLRLAEELQMGDSFWSIAMLQHLDVASMNNNYLQLFFASQIRDKVKGFLSSEVTVHDLMQHRGDVHHLFPRSYLKKKGFDRVLYNQLANFVLCQQEVNLVIRSRAPHVYMQMAVEQCNGGPVKVGNIRDFKELEHNLEEHCIPDTLMKADYEDFESFLHQRRKLIAQRLKNYYESL